MMLFYIPKNHKLFTVYLPQVTMKEMILKSLFFSQLLSIYFTAKEISPTSINDVNKQQQYLESLPRGLLSK